MKNKQQLIQSIQETKEQLSKLEKELASCKTPTIQEANIGDALEDGSIVLIKEKNHAIVVAPQFTEVEASWSKEFSEVFDALKQQEFNPSQWFVPSKELLYLAYQEIPQHFQKRCYWSSSERFASTAYSVNFNNGGQGGINRRFTNCVRAFRVIV